LGSADIDAETLNNVKNSQKTVLEFNDTADFENYYNFYDEITNDELVHVA
jgi:starch synthase